MALSDQRRRTAEHEVQLRQVRGSEVCVRACVRARAQCWPLTGPTSAAPPARHRRLRAPRAIRDGGCARDGAKRRGCAWCGSAVQRVTTVLERRRAKSHSLSLHPFIGWAVRAMEWCGGCGELTMGCAVTWCDDAGGGGDGACRSGTGGGTRARAARRPGCAKRPTPAGAQGVRGGGGRRQQARAEGAEGASLAHCLSSPAGSSGSTALAGMCPHAQPACATSRRAPSAAHARPRTCRFVKREGPRLSNLSSLTSRWRYYVALSCVCVCGERMWVA
jgi:hypothetical protein